MATPTKAPAPTVHRGDFIVRIDRGGEVDEIVCIDCLRCGATMCEATSHTIAADPWWLLNQLTNHHVTHECRHVRAKVVQA